MPGLSTPKIDVVIPVRNGAAYIESCLKSVISQTLPCNRIYVVDDGSIDNTAEIVKAFGNLHPKIKLIRQDKLGVSAARNNGVKNSTAPLIAFLDSDDTWKPEKLFKQAEILKFSEKKTGLIYCSYEFIDEAGVPIKNMPVSPPQKKGKLFNDLLFHEYVLSGSASGVLIKREYLDKAGVFDTELYYGEDWDLWLSLANICEFDYSPETLVSIRVHENSAQRKKIKGKRYEFLKQHIFIFRKWNQFVSKNEEFKDNFKKRILYTLISEFLNPIKIQSLAKLTVYKGDLRSLELFDSYRKFYLYIFMGVCQQTFLFFKGRVCLFFLYKAYKLLNYFRKKNRIRIKVVGGLGNQMFQYAAAAGLSHKKGCALEVDTSLFKSYKLWDFQLSDFSIPRHCFTKEDAGSNKGNFNRILHFFSSKLGCFLFRESNFQEPHFHFAPEIFEIKNSSINLSGYFQSPKYFDFIRTRLLNDFSLKTPLSDTSVFYLEKIKSSKTSIALHVRRGDYVSDQQTAKVHNSLDVEYYKRAVEFFQGKIGNETTFFVFSDDIDFVRRKFDFLPKKLLVDNKGSIAAEDMMLMSNCEHNIIANSSYSWWAAWLNQNPDKIVVAPKNWFQNNLAEPKDIRDLFPSDWVVLK